LVSYAQLESQGFDLSISSGVTPIHHIIRSPDGDEFYAFKTHLNVYRLEDAAPTLRKDSKAVYSAVEWNDIDSTTCSLASIDTPIPTRKRSEITPQTMTISEWHQRLCHLNQWDIIRLSKDPTTGVRIKGPKALPFCEYCQKGKQTRHYPKTPAHPSHDANIP
jgi:GAG-pre-integrase domain